jgi:hypothetical protein
MVSKAERDRQCIVARNDPDRRRLYRAQAAGKLLRVAPHLYARPDYWTTLSKEEQVLHAMRGLQQLHPEWVFAGPSAALAHDLQVAYDDYWPIRIAVCHEPTSLSGSVLRQPIRGDTVSHAHGLRVTSLARTAFDCMREMPFGRGLGIADSVLRQHGWSRERLVEALKDMPAQCVGKRHALETAQFADAGAENGGESAVRARLIELGYQVPELQVEVPNAVEGGTFRADMGWKLADGTWLFGELDGHDKYVKPEMTGGRSAVDVLLDERLRESRISADGSRVMRFSFADAMNAQRFVRILDAYGVPKDPQGPTVIDEKCYRPAGLGG